MHDTYVSSFTFFCHVVSLVLVAFPADQKSMLRFESSIATRLGSDLVFEDPGP